MKNSIAESSLVRRLAGRLRPLSLAIGLLISVLFPAAHYFVGLGGLRGTAGEDARHFAARIEDLIVEEPVLWKYQQYKFMQVQREFMENGEVVSVRVLDQEGRPVVAYEHGTSNAPRRRSWYGPTGSAPLVVNNRTLGTVQLALSQEPLLVQTLVFFLFSLVTGVGLAVWVYRLPVSAISEASRHLHTQHEVTRILAEHGTIGEALPRLLESIGRLAQWDLGEVWMVDSQANLLRRGESWIAPGLDVAAFEAVSRGLTPAPGAGLSGRAWASGRPVWIPDVAADPSFVRGAAARAAGLHAAFAFPIRYAQEVIGVMVFFSRAVRPPEDEFLTVLADVGTRIGSFVRRKRDEEELQRQREVLYQTEKLAAMGQLLAGVAHEMNNPLAVVMGRSTLLRQKVGASPLAEPLEKIEQAANRCSRIVRNFLAMARQLKPDRQAADVNQVVREAVELLAYQLRVDNVEVAFRLAEDLPALWADPHQLHQVAVNLISNAHHAVRQAPPPRNVTLTTRYDRERQRVALEVADSGPGVPPEIRKRIFEPFFTTKPPGEGTGLGLSLCRGIVEEHGGTIRIEGEPGHGAIFVVELPVQALPAAAAAPIESPAAVQGRAILVVEDEPEVASLVAEMLADDGHRVDTASNGALALGKLDAGPWDAIVCDLRMPELDGPGFYDALRRRDSALCRRIVFLTGDTLSPASSAFLEETGAPSLTKPFTVAELRRAVRRVLPAS